MKSKLIKSSLLAVVAATLVLAPAISRADDTNSPSTTETAPKKAGALPFRGAVAAVDTNAMTFTVGTETFSVTSKTKITKDATPATISEITVGESVAGSYKKDADGKLIANVVKIKTGNTTGTKKKKKKAE